MGSVPCNDGNNNYKYDEIGNLIQDNQEDIEEIKWRVDGKIAEIKRGSGSNKQNLVFNYDTQGNRIAKHLYLYGSSNEYLWEKSTYYVRDAQGNVMAVYDLTASGSSGLSYKVAERDIYGSSRIGIVTTPVEMIGANTPTETYPHIIGDKRFNGSNHLGNVLSVFTDKKLPLDIDNNGIIDGYLPQVISANDYAPFGGRLTERTFNKELYPNSFNGKRESAELDGEQDYGERDYDPKKREFDRIDPLFRSYPWYTPYQFAGNKPIWAIDLDGLEEYIYTFKYNDGNPILVEKAYNIEFKNVSETSDQIHFRPFNKATGEEWNPDELGKVQYKYIDEKGNRLNIRRNINGDFVEGSNELMSEYSGNLFGSIYIGHINPLTDDGKFDYRREPQDEADKAAFNHDRAYDKVRAEGIIGTLQIKTLPADKKLVKESQAIIGGGTGKIDGVTGKPITAKTKIRAFLIKELFQNIVNNKAKFDLKLPKSKK